jgi:hypothetical protein
MAKLTAAALAIALTIVAAHPAGATPRHPECVTSTQPHPDGTRTVIAAGLKNNARYVIQTPTTTGPIYVVPVTSGPTGYLELDTYPYITGATVELAAPNSRPVAQCTPTLNS